MSTDDPGRLASPLTEQLGPLVEAAGMVNFLNHGAASHVSSEGCHGVTQEHLERFAALLVAAERERCQALCRRMSFEFNAASKEQAALQRAATRMGMPEYGA